MRGRAIDRASEKAEENALEKKHLDVRRSGVVLFPFIFIIVIRMNIHVLFSLPTADRLLLYGCFYFCFTILHSLR